jgi:hypothetical protein
MSSISNCIILSAGLFCSIYINAISIKEINKLLMFPIYNNIVTLTIINGILFSSSSFMIVSFSIKAIQLLYKK